MKTSEIAIILIVGTLTLLVFVFFLVLIIIEYRRRQVRHITEKMELKHQYESQVLKTQLEVQEQSFKYFSEEVHDNIAQVLALAKLKLNRTAGKTNDETIKTAIEASAELVGKTLNDLRNLSHALDGSLVSRIPLAESIEKELLWVRDAGGKDAELSVTGTPRDIAPEKKLMVFRIVQEAVGNAIKHGEAKKINISLAYENRLLTVQIADDGKGFDTKLLKDSKGLGLHNMQVRAKMLGDLDVVSAAGSGSVITLKINTHEQ